ncbi:MAG: hypothetical protein GY750_04475 [Lentisphaerae bacterium]|nr:hypothetical protein [Lentisphaerota bacterium]MCP4100666.1 hypothetical protein [Lentisphaerota bacterium]
MGSDLLEVQNQVRSAVENYFNSMNNNSISSQMAKYDIMKWSTGGHLVLPKSENKAIFAKLKSPGQNCPDCPNQSNVAPKIQDQIRQEINKPPAEATAVPADYTEETSSNNLVPESTRQEIISQIQNAHPVESAPATSSNAENASDDLVSESVKQDIINQISGTKTATSSSALTDSSAAGAAAMVTGLAAASAADSTTASAGAASTVTQAVTAAAKPTIPHPPFDPNVTFYDKLKQSIDDFRNTKIFPSDAEKIKADASNNLKTAAATNDPQKLEEAKAENAKNLKAKNSLENSHPMINSLSKVSLAWIAYMDSLGTFINMPPLESSTNAGYTSLNQLTGSVSDFYETPPPAALNTSTETVGSYDQLQTADPATATKVDNINKALDGFQANADKVNKEDQKNGISDKNKENVKNLFLANNALKKSAKTGQPVPVEKQKMITSLTSQLASNYKKSSAATVATGAAATGGGAAAAGRAAMASAGGAVSGGATAAGGAAIAGAMASAGGAVSGGAASAGEAVSGATNNLLISSNFSQMNTDPSNFPPEIIDIRNHIDKMDEIHQDLLAKPMTVDDLGSEKVQAQFQQIQDSNDKIKGHLKSLSDQTAKFQVQPGLGKASSSLSAAQNSFSAITQNPTIAALCGMSAGGVLSPIDSSSLDSYASEAQLSVTNPMNSAKAEMSNVAGIAGGMATPSPPNMIFDTTYKPTINNQQLLMASKLNDSLDPSIPWQSDAQGNLTGILSGQAQNSMADIGAVKGQVAGAIPYTAPNMTGAMQNVSDQSNALYGQYANYSQYSDQLSQMQSQIDGVNQSMQAQFMNPISAPASLNANAQIGSILGSMAGVAMAAPTCVLPFVLDDIIELIELNELTEADLTAATPGAGGGGGGGGGAPYLVGSNTGMLICDNGISPAPYMIVPDGEFYLPACVTGATLTPTLFPTHGACDLPSNPTAAAQIFIPTYQCVAVTHAPFIPGYDELFVMKGSSPALQLNDEAFCLFAAGGMIMADESGQFIAEA